MGETRPREILCVDDATRLLLEICTFETVGSTFYLFATTSLGGWIATKPAAIVYTLVIYILCNGAVHRKSDPVPLAWHHPLMTSDHGVFALRFVHVESITDGTSRNPVHTFECTIFETSNPIQRFIAASNLYFGAFDPVSMDPNQVPFAPMYSPITFIQPPIYPIIMVRGPENAETPQIRFPRKLTVYTAIILDRMPKYVQESGSVSS